MINYCIRIVIFTIALNAQSIFACDFNYLSPKSTWPGIQSQLEKVQVHTNAESGFFKKIEIVRRAKSGDELNLMYFIYDQDFTSSFLSKELIYASKRGAKVKLLVDYFMGQNSKQTLQYLQSFKNIDVKLFRPPSDKFHQYLKKELGIQKPKVFTLGLAKQNIELIQQAILSSPELSQKLAYLQQASQNNQVSYQAIMMALHEMSEYQELPLYLEEYSQRLHHKWLSLKSDSLEFIVGGRNISDEYHIGLEELSKKNGGLLRNRNYPFIDTEVSARTLNPAAISQYMNRVDYLWDNSKMTTSIQPLEKSSSVYKSITNKINYRVSKLNRRIADLESRVSSGRSDIQLKKLNSYYSENAPHMEYVSTFESTQRGPSLNKKDINLTWKRLISNAEPSDGPIQIISAYFYLYPDLLKTLDQALSRNIPVEIYTNSMQTTDLSMINIGAYKELETWKNQFSNPELLKIYELQVPAGKGSLHSKIIKIGPHIGIGSANSDPRSFLFDTNNILFFDLSHSMKTANNIFSKYLQNSKFQWNELTPKLINLIKKKISQDKQSKQILKALEIPFFQNQL